MTDELGGLDLSALLAQAQEMSEKLMAAQTDAAGELIEGSSGGGKVRVTMTAGGEVRAVKIDPSVVDPGEVDLLEDLIVAALHDTATRAADWAQEHMGGDLLAGVAGLFGGTASSGSSGVGDRSSVLDVEASEPAPGELGPGPAGDGA
jgi:DNA-binding YbaB/EbfC family protein